MNRQSIMAATLVAALTGSAAAQTDTTFSYQGELMQGGAPAEGTFDMDFSLWAAAAEGSQVGTTHSLSDVPVLEGRFNVDVDFGAAAFSNAARWIEVKIDGITLAPRQLITRTPHAIQTRGIFVDENKRVGIGDVLPIAPLTIRHNEGNEQFGLYVELDSTAVFPTAGSFNLYEAEGRALVGRAGSPTGFAVGVYGLSASDTGRGVVGVSSATSGFGMGVRGVSESPQGYGVFGKSEGHAGFFDGDGYFQGTVGIGTVNPQAKLHVVGDRIQLSESTSAGARSLMLRADGGAVDIQSLTSNIYIHTSGPAGNNNIIMQPEFGEGDVAIGTANPAFTLHVSGTAGKPGGGSWSNTSDRRLKKNIAPLAGALDALLALHGATFEYIDPESINELPGRRIGMIAQEVEQVFPDWVDQRDDGYKTLTYRGFEALTVEALRELHIENQALREKNDNLRARLEAIEQQLGAMAPNTEGAAR